jgi:RNA polymerase sigma-70 factor (ECF subfamily)
MKCEYEQSLRGVTKLKNETEDERDKKIYASMERDVRYVIDWLVVGHEPTQRRGIERRAAYQREILMDPHNIEQLEIPVEIKEDELGTLKRVEAMLDILSTRERECLLMIAEGMTYEEVATVLGCARGSVQTRIKRARRKIINKFG